jgi:hypothetical protein
MAVDFSQPINVVHFTGAVTPATYDRHQIARPERYEILWEGRRWTVGADHIVQGPTDEEGSIDPAYRVENVTK